MVKRLKHDAAFMMAKRLRDVMGYCLGDDDRFAALETFYCICMAGVEDYEMQRERMRPRLNSMLM
jgi:hypothetical protein